MKFKLIISIITILIVIWIWTRPNIYQPFSSRSAYDEGFKLGYGMYPEQADSVDRANKYRLQQLHYHIDSMEYYINRLIRQRDSIRALKH